MCFRGHTALCASGFFQVREGIREWDALRGTKVPNFYMQYGGVLSREVGEYILVSISL